MSIFSDMDSEVQSQIPDRPQRPFPNQIPTSPQMPWLASHFSPEEASINPEATPKALIRQIINIVIRTACILGGAAPFLVGFFTLFSLYK